MVTCNVLRDRFPYGLENQVLMVSSALDTIADKDRW